MTFVREAWPLVGPLAAASLVLFVLGYPPWAWGLLILALLVLLFFRNPTRTYSGDPAVLLAPADGRILRVDEVEVAAMGGITVRRVVTFLSVFNVHVQRSPTGGEVVHTEYREGARVAAFRPEAGEVNQQNLTVLRTDGGELVGVRQIAGLVARRVVGYLARGDEVGRGDLLGVIKFGSRVDLLVPMDYRIEVAVGDRVQAGRTPMARRALDGTRAPDGTTA